MHCQVYVHGIASNFLGVGGGGGGEGVFHQTQLPLLKYFAELSVIIKPGETHVTCTEDLNVVTYYYILYSVYHTGFTSLLVILIPSVASSAVRLEPKPSPATHWRLRREETIREHCSSTRKYVLSLYYVHNVEINYCNLL